MRICVRVYPKCCQYLGHWLPFSLLLVFNQLQGYIGKKGKKTGCSSSDPSPWQANSVLILSSMEWAGFELDNPCLHTFDLGHTWLYTGHSGYPWRTHVLSCTLGRFLRVSLNESHQLCEGEQGFLKSLRPRKGLHKNINNKTALFRFL